MAPYSNMKKLDFMVVLFTHLRSLNHQPTHTQAHTHRTATIRNYELDFSSGERSREEELRG